jgi:23S rRNA (uracil1939-C5)-methyltransferase
MTCNPRVLTTRVTDLTHEGRGVAGIDGQRVFVSGALPGETVTIRPRGKRRKYQEAELVDVLEASPDRVEPPCEVFGRCGGCTLQHMSRPAQIRFKQRTVEQTLARVGGLQPDHWLEPVIDAQWGYRRRARLSVRDVPRKERVLVGFRERATQYVTDMSSCPVLTAPMDGLIAALSELIGNTSLRAKIPQIEVAVADHAAAVVLRVLATPSTEDLTLLRAFGDRHDVDVYTQSGGPGTVAPVDPARERRLSYALPEFNLDLQFLPVDFVQVNAAVNQRLVRQVVDLAEARGDDRVLDLYCGLGNLSLPLAQRAGALVGVEGEAGLVARAVQNAERNGIANARFVTADLSQTDWSFLRESWDIVILDPPRTGAEAPVAAMDRMAPRRIVYVSCHPGTLARDAKVLTEHHGYRLHTAGVLDMFPNTWHVEAIALFVRD